MEHLISGIVWTLYVVTSIWKYFMGRDIPALSFKQKPSPFVRHTEQHTWHPKSVLSTESRVLKIGSKILIQLITLYRTRTLLSPQRFDIPHAQPTCKCSCLIPWNASLPLAAFHWHRGRAISTWIPREDTQLAGSKNCRLSVQTVFGCLTAPKHQVLIFFLESSFSESWNACLQMQIQCQLFG